jgi:hypothetical protein
MAAPPKALGLPRVGAKAAMGLLPGEAQEKPAEGPGLPGTTCAPDLFDRIEKIGDVAEVAAGFPVRYFLGFTTPLPDLNKLRPNSWMAKMVEALEPKQKDAWALWLAKQQVTIIFATIVWLLGIWADIMVLARRGPGTCKHPGLKTIKADIAAKELMCKLSLTNPEWHVKIDEYARNYLCPTETMDVGTAIGAFLHDDMSRAEAVKFGKLHNLCPAATEALIEERKSRPVIQQLVTLYRRGELTEEEYYAEARALGWIDTEYVTLHHTLSQWWPSPSEVIGAARRGVVEDQAAQAFGLDRYFAAAYTEDVAAKLRGAGVDEAAAKWLWRSQFGPVDLATAYDWYRRSEAGLLPAGVTFDETALKLSILHSDLPPAYHDVALAAVWSPLGIRQLRGAYDEYLVTPDYVFGALRQAGYDEQSAVVLLEQWQKLRPEYRRRKIGAGGARDMTRLYAEAVIGEQEYRAELEQLGFGVEEIAEAVSEAKAERLRRHRAELIKYLKARYLKGEIGDSQVSAVLISTGLEPADAVDLLQLWSAELELHPRQVSAAELCTWFKQGLITERYFLFALARLRYSSDDALRIIASCGLADAEKKLREAQRLLKTKAAKGANSDSDLLRALHEAEKLVGGVESRWTTKAGRQLAWIERRVTGKPKPVSKKSPRVPAPEGNGEPSPPVEESAILPGEETHPPEVPPPEAPPGESPPATSPPAGESSTPTATPETPTPSASPGSPLP